MKAVQAGAITRSETWTTLSAFHLSMHIVREQQDVSSLARALWETPAAVAAPHATRQRSAPAPTPRLWLLWPARMHVPHDHLMGHPSTWLRPSEFSEVLRSGRTWRSTVTVLADAPVSTASTKRRRGPMVARSMQLAGRSAPSWLPLPAACMEKKKEYEVACWLSGMTPWLGR